MAKGFMQLYSFEQQKSQPLEAHAASFASVKVRGGRHHAVLALVKPSEGGNHASAALTCSPSYAMTTPCSYA